MNNMIAKYTDENELEMIKDRLEEIQLEMASDIEVSDTLDEEVKQVDIDTAVQLKDMVVGMKSIIETNKDD